MADYGDILWKSLKFSVHPKRWLPFFIVDAVFYAAIAQLLLSNMGNLVGLISSAELGIEAVVPILSFFALAMLYFVVFWLVRLWVQGAVVLQSAREKESVAGAFRYPPRRYVSLVIAVAVVAIIGWIVGLVPVIGPVFTIIVSIVLVFIMQGVMVSKLGFAESLKNSYAMFRHRPGSVFLAWLATALISLVITGIFLLPAFIAFGAVLFPVLIGIGAEASFMSVLSAVLQNINMLVAVGLVFLVGSSIAGAFGIKSITEFYLAWKKKKTL